MLVLGDISKAGPQREWPDTEILVKTGLRLIKDKEGRQVGASVALFNRRFSSGGKSRP